MYAIIEVGAKQYSVKKGDVIDVEKQAAKEGKDITLNKVLLVSKDKKIELGQPHVKDAKVEAQVLKHIKDEKKYLLSIGAARTANGPKGTASN